MAKLPKNKNSKVKSAPPLKGQGKSLANTMKPERSGGFGSAPIAKTATKQDYHGAKGKGGKKK